MRPNLKSWMISTTMTVDFGSEENVNIFLNAYKPESDTIKTKRSIVDIKSDGPYVIFEIGGSDINAMRASLNSILNFTNVIKKTLDFVEN